MGQYNFTVICPKFMLTYRFFFTKFKLSALSNYAGINNS